MNKKDIKLWNKRKVFLLKRIGVIILLFLLGTIVGSLYFQSYEKFKSVNTDETEECISECWTKINCCADLSNENEIEENGLIERICWIEGNKPIINNKIITKYECCPLIWCSMCLDEELISLRNITLGYAEGRSGR